MSYLVKNRAHIRGMVLTHGHEDHIGATPYVLRQIPMPLYGTKLTLALVDLKLKEHRVPGVALNVIKPSDVITMGKFTVEFIHVNHSIAGAVALAITCPAGTIIMSGDFKIDFTPIDGHVIDLATFAAYGRKGVLAPVRVHQRGAQGPHHDETKIATLYRYVPAGQGPGHR